MRSHFIRRGLSVVGVLAVLGGSAHAAQADEVDDLLSEMDELSQEASAGTPVAYNDLQPGDIVSFYGGASHVGIYIGDGKIIDALNSGTPVGVRTLDYMPFNNAVRF